LIEIKPHSGVVCSMRAPSVKARVQEHDRHQSLATGRSQGSTGGQWNNGGASGDCWRHGRHCGSPTKYREI